MQKSSLGMEQNIAALLIWLLSIFFSFIPGLVFFLIEKENKFVRFHAMQSIILTVITALVCILLFWLVVPLIVMPIIMLVGCIICAIKGYQNEQYKLPLIGNLAEKWS